MALLELGLLIEGVPAEVDGLPRLQGIVTGQVKATDDSRTPTKKRS
jgi:hypothetical protein